MYQKNSLNTESTVNHLRLKYSKKEVQKAGEILIVKNISKNDPNAYKESMFILSNWRASHIHSLHNITSFLQRIAIYEDRKAIVVKRLKRAPSIVNKLLRFDNMKLRNMQDIAGCRAILSTNKNVYKVFKKLDKLRTFRVKNYIYLPKEDGYRSIHLVCKCDDEEHGEKGAKYPVEIQLRSKIQHSWATAVEIVDLFTNQTLKSNEGKKDWLDFFKYISHEFSKLEKVDNKPIDNSMSESIRLIKKLDIYKKFDVYANSLKLIENHINSKTDEYYLINMDLKAKTINLYGFSYNNFDEAAVKYLTLEKKSEKDKKYVIAFVSSKSVSNLKEAYPNYFADSELFIENIRKIENINRRENPSWFLKFLLSTGLGKRVLGPRVGIFSQRQKRGIL